MSKIGEGKPNRKHFILPVSPQINPSKQEKKYSRLQELLPMANGEGISHTRIIMFAVTIVIAINGTLWLAINKQRQAIDELTALIYTKMDDRYRRWEANDAHKAILERIRAGEKRDDRLENEIEAHIIADDKIHK
jgi:hypothetical protein